VNDTRVRRRERAKSHRQRNVQEFTFREAPNMHEPNERCQRVLVVDDDPAIQQMCIALLRRNGVNTDVVGDGETALQRLRSLEYDAILLDLMLPRTNGFEVIRHLKCSKPDLLNRVIVVTAASERTLRWLDTHDVRTVLRKPFDIHDLVAEVRACISQTPDGNGAGPRGETT
jgi:DNA-binding response OmpR family regulator